MSFKDAKKLAAADSANTTLMTAELAAVVTADDNYTLCTDGRYEIYSKYSDDKYS